MKQKAEFFLVRIINFNNSNRSVMWLSSDSWIVENTRLLDRHLWGEVPLAWWFSRHVSFSLTSWSLCNRSHGLVVKILPFDSTYLLRVLRLSTNNHRRKFPVSFELCSRGAIHYFSLALTILVGCGVLTRGPVNEAYELSHSVDNVIRCFLDGHLLKFVPSTWWLPKKAAKKILKTKNSGRDR